MIKPWIKGTVVSCQKTESHAGNPGFYRHVIEVSHVGGEALPEGYISTFVMDIYEGLPSNVKIEFIYEIGEPDA